MKLLVILALVAVAAARTLNPDVERSAFGYSVKYGIPLAKKIREAEEKQQRITGGTPSVTGQFPYQAGLIIQYINLRSDAVCGASLVTANRLTTAAHCWFDGLDQASQFTVVLGSVYLFAGGTRIVANQVVMHPNWNPLVSGVRDDIAIIYLPTSVAFSSTIAPIALPSGNEVNQDFAGLIATASGFGLTQDGGSITASQFLSHVNLNVLSNAECTTVFDPSVVLDTILCARGPVVGQSTCSSDSGGPLAIINNNRPLLIGIVGFGASAGCEHGFPTGFARVTSHLSFINQNL